MSESKRAAFKRIVREQLKMFPSGDNPKAWQIWELACEWQLGVDLSQIPPPIETLEKIPNRLKIDESYSPASSYAMGWNDCRLTTISEQQKQGKCNE